MRGIGRTGDRNRTMNGGASRQSGDDERGKLQSLGCRATSIWLLLDFRGYTC